MAVDQLRVHCPLNAVTFALRSSCGPKQTGSEQVTQLEAVSLLLATTAVYTYRDLVFIEINSHAIKFTSLQGTILCL